MEIIYFSLYNLMFNFYSFGEWDADELVHTIRRVIYIQTRKGMRSLKYTMRIRVDKIWFLRSIEVGKLNMLYFFRIN